MFDSTAALGLERFAAAMESMLTPRNQKWHRLQASNPILNKDRETKLWFEEATNILSNHWLKFVEWMGECFVPFQVLDWTMSV